MGSKYSESEGTHKDPGVQLLVLHRTIPKNSTTGLRVFPKRFLNSGRLGTVTTSLGAFPNIDANFNPKCCKLNKMKVEFE